MADFVAVLKKTIDAQADQSPELRQRVYAKARATIEQKLVTANASQAFAVRQRNLLEAAIAEVEAYYAPSPKPTEEPVDDALEDFLHGAEPDQTRSAADDQFAAEPQPGRAEKAPGQDGGSDFAVERADAGFTERAHETDFSRLDDRERPQRRKPHEKRNFKAWAIAALALIVIAGAGYAFWTNKDNLQELATSMGRKDVPAASSGSDQASETAMPEQPETKPEPKMTQRLLPDGTERDEGPAGGTPGIGEGTSTAQATPVETPQTSATEQPAVTGQEALLYEERSGTESGTVLKGTVQWSVIEESPSEGEPAQLKMTFRKNTDQSIPASHLVELFFTVPEDFSGGVVDNVQRITFKDTEEAAGNPLIAVPSKIADNFFIIWLNDARTAIDTNLKLMRNQHWLDIPISYRNGRRALISLEKGAPGEKAFNEVFGGN